MKRRILLPVAILLAPAPAYATTGLVCSTAGSSPLRLALVISHTAVPSVVSARLTDNGREIPAVVAQSWFDANEVRVDVVDRNAMRHEARIRASRNGASYDGSIWRGSKRRWVRCRES